MEVDYIKNRVKGGFQNLQNRMEKDIKEMCENILMPLTAEFGERDLPEELLERLRRYFRDIYWSLKVHLLFHLGIPDKPQEIDILLNKVGAWGGLTDDEMSKLPDQNLVVDPGSKLLEMFSDIMDNSGDKGSKAHADRVMRLAKDKLKKLTSTNIFKPKVLAKVSHGDRSFIGASIAVSFFLRPICLLYRIINLKQSLGKAIVHFEPLDIPDRQNWKFEAFQGKTYHQGKKLCESCNMMFCGGCSGNGRLTFLAACAEYCPVNQLLPDELNLGQSDDAVVTDRLRRNLARCSDLFENFSYIFKRCKDAVHSGDENIIEAVYWEVIYKLHIFGLWPECNPYF